MSEEPEKPVIPKPPRRSRLDAPPPPTDAPVNLVEKADTGTLADLNFKVHPDFHWMFKRTAANWRLSMKELLEASFKTWLDQNGPMPKEMPQSFMIGYEKRQ